MLEAGQWIATSVFGATPGQGNPMVVARLPAWPGDAELHARSRQLPAEEVTIAVQEDAGWVLRWFGPHGEVPFCGHGALAAAALLPAAGTGQPLAALGGPARLRLQLGQDGGLPALGMPAMKLAELDPRGIDLGVPVTRLFDAGRDYLAVLPDEASLRTGPPRRDCMLALDKIGVIATARMADATAAFRFFAPRAGIEEDRASCSVLPALAALWLADRLAEGVFVQCSGVDIAMPVRRSEEGWQVRGRVHVTGQGTWPAVQPHPTRDTERTSPC